jgi:hypothetical protein
MPHYYALCATVNCYSLSNKVRLSFFLIPKEANSTYSDVHAEIQDISKNVVCHRISMLFSSSDMTSSVNGASIWSYQ